MLGADRVIATKMVQEDGRYTGDIEFYAYAGNKASAIEELAEAEGYDLSASFAYCDSATDVPMLEIVGHPHAVNPDKALRKIANDRGWPVLDFVKPVELRKRVPFETRKGTLAAVAIGAGVAAAGRSCCRRGAHVVPDRTSSSRHHQTWRLGARNLASRRAKLGEWGTCERRPQRRRRR